MTIKHLLLINPVNPARIGLTVNKSSRFPPLGLGIVAALTPQDWQITLIDENWEPFIFQPADLVGITAFTASAPRAYEIAAQYRANGTPVVMGGIHASMCPEEASQYVDTIVVGEAEGSWPTLIADFMTGQLKPRYEAPLADPKAIPHPRRDLFHPDYQFASVQTSRGCPMDCDFCTVPVFNGKRYRRRPIDEILDELETIPQQMVFLVDDNIIGYGPQARQEALDLFQGIVARGIRKMWFCQASLNFGDDPEVLEWAARAGCKMVFLGLEADEAEALGEVNKLLNLKRGVGAYEESFRNIKRAGISVLGAFIFGMDHDTPASLARRGRYMIHSGVDVMQTTYLTPLPGTRFFQRMQEEGRLLFTDFPGDWARYDMGDVVFQPAQMTRQELAEGMGAASRRMFRWPVLIWKALRTFAATRSFPAAMFAFMSNINYRNVSLAED